MCLTLKLNLSGPAGRLARQLNQQDKMAASWFDPQYFFGNIAEPGGRHLHPPGPPTVKKCCCSLTELSHF